MMTSSNGNIFRVTGPLCGEYSPHKCQWHGALICAGINGWVNNGEAGDLRRHRSNYDVIVMVSGFNCVATNLSLTSKLFTAIFRGSIRFTKMDHKRPCTAHIKAVVTRDKPVGILQIQVHYRQWKLFHFFFTISLNPQCWLIWHVISLKQHQDQFIYQGNVMP